MAAHVGCGVIRDSIQMAAHVGCEVIKKPYLDSCMLSGERSCF